MRTRLFKSGNSMALRIPTELSFEDSVLEVEIERVGDSLVISPAGAPLARVLECFAAFAPDFMTTGREPNDEQERTVSGGPPKGSAPS